MSEHEQRQAAYLEQLRAKYTTAQLKALKAKGHTFPGGTSYPIDDADDLSKAIKAVGRGGADHDAIRKYVIAMAKAMGESSKIPDNWNADGSLDEEKSGVPTNAQLRALPAGMTYNDMMALLEGAVNDKFNDDKDTNTCRCWVTDFNDEWLIYSDEGDRFQVPYTIKDKTVKLGKATQVAQSTTYSPIETKSARNAPTSEDYGIAYALKDAKMQLAGAKAKQLADPDYKTDPDDAEVMKHLEDAEAAIDEAIIAQSKDGHEDARSSSPSPNWATPKARSLFTTGAEWTPPQTVEAQVRMEADEENPHLANFRGFPSPTGIAYSVRDWLGEYEETMHPGAWAKTIRESREIPTLLNHNTDGVPLANTTGTKELAETERGLREDSVFDKRDANTNSICVQLERGVLKKMSVSFRAVKESWNDAYDKRGVIEGALYETSIVTFPASPSAEGGLVDAMRSALGREGRSLWLADGELSVRSALPVFIEHGQLPDDGENVIEKALRALAHADETVARSVGAHGRARTFLLAEAMVELRAGKTLSAKNQGLLQTALTALSAADKQHEKLAASHAQAAEAVQGVVGGSSGTGVGKGTPPSNGNPILPNDGAGPRSVNPHALARAREQELAQLRSRR